MYIWWVSVQATSTLKYISRMSGTEAPKGCSSLVYTADKEFIWLVNDNNYSLLWTLKFEIQEKTFKGFLLISLFSHQSQAVPSVLSSTAHCLAGSAGTLSPLGERGGCRRQEGTGEAAPSSCCRSQQFEWHCHLLPYPISMNPTKYDQENHDFVYLQQLQFLSVPATLACSRVQSRNKAEDEDTKLFVSSNIFCYISYQSYKTM